MTTTINQEGSSISLNGNSGRGNRGATTLSQPRTRELRERPEESEPPHSNGSVRPLTPGGPMATTATSPEERRGVREPLDQRGRCPRLREPTSRFSPAPANASGIDDCRARDARSPSLQRQKRSSCRVLGCRDAARGPPSPRIGTESRALANSGAARRPSVPSNLGLRESGSNRPGLGHACTSRGDARKNASH